MRLVAPQSPTNMSLPAVASAAPARLARVLQMTPLATSASSAPPASDSLSSFLATLRPCQVDRALPTLLLSLSSAAAEIAVILRGMAVSSVHSSNTFGDEQLNVDIATHQCVLAHLASSGVVATASSEEDPTLIDLSSHLRPEVGCEQVYSVGFDPLDGSSIIAANWSVGSIFSLFPGRSLLSQRVNQQEAAAVVVYGPRTTMVIGMPGAVFEATLGVDGKTWTITNPHLRIAPKTNIFSPANLRCTTEDAGYRKLVQYYIDAKYTLRYSGGLVPDFAHVLTKGHGIFLSPVTPSNQAKLRVVYECAALSMLSVWAGGAAVNERGEEMGQMVLREYDLRSGLIIGSSDEVERYRQMQKAKAKM
jgi:sedoheptulose-bisphosphatase